MGGARNLKLEGNVRGGKCQGTGGKRNRCEWIKCLQMALYQNQLFAWGSNWEGAGERCKGMGTGGSCPPPLPSSAAHDTGTIISVLSSGKLI